MTDPTLHSPDTIRLLIDLWKAAVQAREVVASPPSLALALGLSSTVELEELSKQPELTMLIKQAQLWMEAEWYRLLSLSSKDASASGVQFALKTMGRRDTEAANRKEKGGLHVHMYGGHKAL